MMSATAVLLAFCGLPTQAQVASILDERGRRVFINDEPPAVRHASNIKAGSAQFSGRTANMSQSAALANRQAYSQLPKEGLERMVHEVAERHRVDPALVRAVVIAESNWNPSAVSRKGALGLMQLIPGTAQRFGVGDPFNPQQNLDGGVRYLRTLLERYNGNLNLSLAAYNAGEGAVARARGIPHYRETRVYVQKVTDFYFRPDSDRLPSWWIARHSIQRTTDGRGRVIFTNE